MTVPFREALATWFKIGWLSFGGPAGQIALMHRVIVEEKKWVDEARYLHALNFSMLLPGPEAQKLATYVGWLLHGVPGGLAAGILFVLPGAVVMLAMSLLYVLGQGVPVVDGALFGIKAAVLVIVVEALIRIGRRALKGALLVTLAAAAFVGIFFLDLPFPLIIAAAAAVGYLTTREASAVPEAAPPGRWKAALRAALVGMTLWVLPIVLAAAMLGPGHVFVDIGYFFSKLAVVSFGGAYALLSYMAQEAVETYRWMSAPEMVDGLGLAETLPGPLIKVTQFVGFLGAWRDPGPLSPVTAAILGSALTTWVTFVPPMMLTFAGAPFVEALRANRRLSGALAAVTAAVVGVILNLTVWFVLHVVFPDVHEVRTGMLRWYAFDPLAADLRALGLATVAALLAFRFRWGLIQLIVAMAAAGVVLRPIAP